MKHMLVGLFVMSILLITGFAQAESFCGGTPMFNADISGNKRPWTVSCCPDGYRVQGIACADLPPAQDLADGCSVVCRSIQKGNLMKVIGDFQRQPEQMVCHKTEVMAGIMCKDMAKHSKGDDDVADSCTAVCQKPGSNTLRTIPRGDIDGNPREQQVYTTLLPQRVVGLACKDVDKGTSDRMDGCTPIVK